VLLSALTKVENFILSPMSVEAGVATVHLLDEKKHDIFNKTKNSRSNASPALCGMETCQVFET
jgi:hypothetical protein